MIVVVAAVVEGPLVAALLHIFGEVLVMVPEVVVVGGVATVDVVPPHSYVCCFSYYNPIFLHGIRFRALVDPILRDRT